MLSKTVLRSFSTAAKQKVGFLGLGNMGLPMAKNLVNAGFAVNGFDLSDSTLKKAEELGINPTTKISDTVTDVDYVVTALPRTHDVKNALYNDDGVFAIAKKGTMICDVSTISPVATQQFVDHAKSFGMVYCDTPMSGGIQGADAGTLTFMVGCDGEEQFQKTKVILDVMGNSVLDCGGPAKGIAVKLCNNLILAIQMVSVSEGFALGSKLGLDPKILQSIFSVSTTQCWCTDTGCPAPGVIDNARSSHNYDGGFGISLLRKDMDLILESCDSVNFKPELTKTVRDYNHDLETSGHGHKDFAFVYEYLNAKYDTSKL